MIGSANRTAGAFLLVVACLLVSCGESGSNPPLFAEVRWLVQPDSGQATFEVPSLMASDTGYTSQSGTPFVTTGGFSFLVEGAAFPYSATFVQVEDGMPIRVSFFIAGFLAINCEPTRGKDTCVVASDTGCTVYESKAECLANSPVPATNANPEVRFDVCSPLIGAPSCATTTNPPGRFGVPFNGVLGDFFRSFLLGTVSTQDPPTATPSIYFLQSPDDQVSGVFRSNDGTLLDALLFINGALIQADSGFSGDDAVLNSDI